ncbi:MAG TPA: signal peptidase I [bacterium]|uniref:Signal peptidase I n=1 Tax=candidate division TA06 bacterium ADurb.Bin417 TaxID=1852828 RepID=A0A1V5MCP5_UNCT6|nr:MAG: Signal peptidase IB [candidate division TA06 bacterium ADurb.Bin417]HNQ35623.1 signal peptidase I [bacterium]HNS47919.1 signal peptidase I [bacterium]
MSRRFVIIDAVVSVLIIFAAYFFFSVKQGGFFYIDSESMEPTLQPGDRLVLVKAGSLERGQIVVFRHESRKVEFYVKRLVGLPGDQVAVRGGRLYLNGQAQEEPYLKERRIVYNYGPIQVPEAEYFVLGDNRNNSEDSSVFGCVPAGDIRGRVLGIYWPWHRRLRLALSGSAAVIAASA